MKLHSIACLLLASPLALTGQLIIDTDPAPGAYDEIRSTGTNTVNMGDGVITGVVRSLHSSTFNQSGGQSGLNYARNSNLTGGTTDEIFALHTGHHNVLRRLILENSIVNLIS